ncbi:MAG: glycosyltransferase family 39 protein [Lysobacteraceae bacterium]
MAAGKLARGQSGKKARRRKQAVEYAAAKAIATRASSPRLLSNLRWWHALLVLVAIKAAWLYCDAIPRLFLMDSAFYLHAAIYDWIPPDRSFTYPWLLRYLVMLWQSPYALIVVQSLAGVASAWLLWSVLRRRFGVGDVIALLAAALFACDPAQVFYERMVMAEAFGGLLLMTTFAATVEYVATARIRWLVALEVCGLAAISLRLNLLPVVLVMGAVAPLLLFRHVDMRRMAAHLLCALILLSGLHGAYRHFVGHAMHAAPEWSGRSGMMELGLVAPLVKPEHLAAEGFSPTVLKRVRYDLSDPRKREIQMWSDKGLNDLLGANVDANGDALAGRIAHRAVRDDPFGLLRLGMHNLEDYFDPRQKRSRSNADLAGNRPYRADVQADARIVLNAWVEGTQKVESPARLWFGFATWWLVACWLALPLLGALACWRLHRNCRTAVGSVLLLYALGLPISHFLFSPIVSYRYLHPMPAFALIALAVLVAPRLVALEDGHA